MTMTEIMHSIPVQYVSEDSGVVILRSQRWSPNIYILKIRKVHYRDLLFLTGIEEEKSDLIVK